MAPPTLTLPTRALSMSISARDALNNVASFLQSRTGIARASSTDCNSTGDNNLCEKPADSGKTTWIVIVVTLVVGVVIILGVLIALHMRRVRRDKREELAPHELDDYGFDPSQMAGAKGPRGRGAFHHHQQMPVAPSQQQQQNFPMPHRLSMDSSMTTLARSMPPKDDPFGPAAEISYGDAASQRSGAPPPAYVQDGEARHPGAGAEAKM